MLAAPRMVTRAHGAGAGSFARPARTEEAHHLCMLRFHERRISPIIPKMKSLNAHRIMTMNITASKTPAAMFIVFVRKSPAMILLPG